MQYQLRDYTIMDGIMSQFVAEWKSQVVPLRAQAGFEIVSAWSSSETGRFVWIIGFEGDFEEADRLYYESPGRIALSPDPARLVLVLQCRRHEFGTGRLDEPGRVWG